MVEEKEEYEMGLPNGVGEAMLAHAFEKFDIKLEQTEFGPKVIGSKGIMTDKKARTLNIGGEVLAFVW